MPLTTEMTAAAVQVASCFVASAWRTRPCGAGFKPVLSMVECEVSVPQSSAGACGHSTPAAGSKGRRARTPSVVGCELAAMNHGAQKRPGRRMGSA